MYPQTHDEWAQSALDNKEDLLAIVELYCGLNAMSPAHAAFDSGDWRSLADILEAAWEKAPDDPSIHAVPGWDELCDLCSESHLLYL